jgi:hypothetical protein
VADSENYEVISLTFFRNWHELVKKYKLTNEQYGAAVYAMCEYCFYNIETELESPAGIIYEMAKPNIKASNKRKITGHTGGSKSRGGGAPTGNTNASKKKAQ